MNKEIEELVASHLNRRSFLLKASLGLGSVALGSLLAGQDVLSHKAKAIAGASGITGMPDIPARTKRVVYLFLWPKAFAQLMPGNNTVSCRQQYYHFSVHVRQALLPLQQTADRSIEPMPGAGCLFFAVARYNCSALVRQKCS